jgi:hypothetical protein
MERLSERRVNPVLPASHLLGRESEAHCLDQRLDDRGGLVAHDVRTEQSPVFWSATSLTIPVVSSVAQP